MWSALPMVVIFIEKFKLKKLEKKMADKNFIINSYVDNLLDVTWTLNNLRHKLKDIPDGYKHFYQDVGNHWGGVFMLSRAHMEAINGFNPLYIGWGKEEEETRLRLANKNLQCFRHEQGLFYALDHTDNCPPMDDPDFINNHKLLNEYNKDKPQVGFKELKAEVKTFNFSEEGWEKVTWLKIKNFEIC